ncbi:hypothetical protein DFH08DRAFT_824729 [Mycena albidolilacea]|uniref:ABC transmembrane type-1 domain-containing protein n=1 Tax=Mycena albidolilacea TaxID=1033008 RepID=A0AAD7E9Y9_9AGAR|nr:hypothetical protein DFH08DRAFT_824729 [Mycena albidolilacea]
MHEHWENQAAQIAPPPAPASLDDAPISQYVTASLFSRLTYTWITPMMVMGSRRTLQASDLWRMGPEQEAGYLTDRLEATWARRVEAAESWNTRLASGEVKPGLVKRVRWAFSGKREEMERMRREEGGKREASLVWALNDVLGHLFWAFQDTSQIMGPLLVKALINFANATAAAKTAGESLPNVGRGIVMALDLPCIIVFASICQDQFFVRAMTTGVLARTALTGALYRRALHLTPAARLRLPNSAVLNHMSAQWFHAAWTTPIQTMGGLMILLVQLGPSALAGFGLLVLIIPTQERVLGQQFKFRQQSLRWTDKRAAKRCRVLEVVSSMRVVKYFCYKGSFLRRLSISRVVILDEAIASVDLEPDNKIQRTIQTQFKNRTLICIAHRLRTIISYDRILDCILCSPRCPGILRIDDRRRNVIFMGAADRKAKFYLGEPENIRAVADGTHAHTPQSIHSHDTQHLDPCVRSAIEQFCDDLDEASRQAVQGVTD